MPVAAGSLAACADTCARALQTYSDDGEASGEFGGALRAAIAAMAMVAERGDADLSSGLLIAARSVCRDAATTCRRHGLDETLLRAAAACERAATIFDHARSTLVPQLTQRWAQTLPGRR